MAHTHRDTTADLRGDSLAEFRGNVTSPPSGPASVLSTSSYPKCQQLDKLRPGVLRALAGSVVRTVEIASFLHSAGGGATVSLIHGNLAGQKCYAVSVHPERTIELPSAPGAAELFTFVLNNLSLLLGPERALGTWVNTEKCTHVVDVVACVSDREMALELGSQFRQLSIFDLAAGREILVGPDKPTSGQTSRHGVKS
jgi:hypothetical protein